MRYDITDFLPKGAAALAAAARYPRLSLTTAKPTRTEDGRCPLGVALPECGWPTPLGGDVADALVGRLDEGADQARWWLVANAAWHFVGDWDAGLIADLAEALGVAG